MRQITLEDRFETEEGQILITGKQALARVPLLQRRLDDARGLRTAGFVSGYRGSPLGTMDHELGKIRARLDAAGVVFEPGLNEDLAMTAVWGAQQLDFVPRPKVEGVFGIWYGKGPGVDRSGDAIRHLNMSGTHPKGGVLICFGDDHPGKSSSLAHQSDLSLAAMEVPVLYPSDISDILRFSLAGIALSRESGLAVGLKIVNETADGTEVVDMSLSGMTPKVRDAADEDRSIRAEMLAVTAQDQRMVQRKLPAVHPFTRRNGIDQVGFGADRPTRLGIVTAGKSYRDTLDALRVLGIDAARAKALGIGVLKVGLIWPMDPDPLTAFAGACPELLFVEEKRPQMEAQAPKLLWSTGLHPAISGKTTPEGAPLIPSDRMLYPVDIAAAIAARLDDPEVNSRATRLAEDTKVDPTTPVLTRPPMFCSGCPHNRSTQLPDGAFGVAGIGCHGLVQFMDRNPLPCTHMGAEGVNWVGLAPFTETPHVFVNLGDGTYSHSGSLAIRAAAASPANVTFKILVNDVVAMTGGQDVESGMSVAAMAQQVRLDGVREVIVVAEDPEDVHGLPAGTRLWPRTRLMEAQEALRATPGTTVLIYVQLCATELRKRRKRGTAPNAPTRAVIHPEVCEGCGDCSRASNCASIQPLETEFGRKRQIDQASCNSDLSCVEGFCPSFLTLSGARRREPETPDFLTAADALAAPVIPMSPAPTALLMAGIGGTGVVTTTAILAMAAHLDGRGASLYDMTGLAQKGGTVFSHLRILPLPGTAPYRLGHGDADVLIASDMVAATQAEALQCLQKNSRVLADPRLTAPQKFHEHPGLDLSGRVQLARLSAQVALPPRLVDATALAEAHFGAPVLANMILIGAAWQEGLIPLPLSAIDAAIEMNGAAVSSNRQAFALGRLVVGGHPLAVVPARVSAVTTAPIDRIEDKLALRVQTLIAYQGADYAARFTALVDRVRTAEARIRPGSDLLTRTVMDQAFRVMRIKDEYEVARLWSDPAIWQEIDAQFEGGIRSISIAPPGLLRRRGDKVQVPEWLIRPVFRLLSRMTALRGTPVDPFGYSQERRQERALRDLYLSRIADAVDHMTAETYESVLVLARIPDPVRGYGHVKAPRLAAAIEALTDWTAQERADAA